MQQNGTVIGRRQLLAGGAMLPRVLSSLRAQAKRSPGLRLEYAAKAPPKVPSPLSVDAPARLVVEFEDGQCSLCIRVLSGYQPALMPLAVWIGDEGKYLQAREALRLPAFRAEIGWNGHRWTLSIAGQSEFSAEAGPPDPDSTPVPTEPPWLAFRHTLDPDWRQGPLGSAPAELWRILRVRSPARALQVPAIETRGSLDGWLDRLGAGDPVSASLIGHSSGFSAEFVQDVDRDVLEHFAFRNYRSGSLGLVPHESEFVNTDQLERYRAQRQVSLTGLVIVAVDCFAGTQGPAATLPPPLELIPNPTVRVMAIRGLDDPSLDEAWLFIECGLNGRRAWYAASHLRGSLGSSAWGREVLGYPTQDGATSASLGGNRFASAVGRRGKSLFEADGFYGGFSTGTSLFDLPVVALRLRPESRDGAPSGELVLQQWHFQGLRKVVHRSSIEASFPASTPEAGAWGKIGPVRPYSAAALDGASMQRKPGSVAAATEGIGPYYQDRCDGILPWEGIGAPEPPDASD